MSEVAWAQEFDRGHLYRFRARYVRCVDGDTIEVEVDQGYYDLHIAQIRLRGYSAAETYQPGGDEATARMEAAIAKGVGGKWPLRVICTQKVTRVMQQMTFTRYVGDVLVEMADGSLVNVVDLVQAAPREVA